MLVQKIENLFLTNYFDQQFSLITPIGKFLPSNFAIFITCLLLFCVILITLFRLILSFRSSNQVYSGRAGPVPGTSQGNEVNREVPLPPLLKLTEGEDDDNDHVALIIRSKIVGRRVAANGKIYKQKKIDLLIPWQVLSPFLQHHQIRNIMRLHHPGLVLPLSHHAAHGTPSIRYHYL